MKKVLISIPAFNEEKTIGNLIKNIKHVMSKTNHEYLIQVVNDGSTDKTADIAKEAGAMIFSHQTNMGLAETFRSEINQFLKSNADIMVHIDADAQYSPEDIPKLIREIENGYDLVLGDRFSGGIESMPLIKRIGNKAFSRVISKIIRLRINDCQTGFRAFSRNLAAGISITSNHP